MIIRDGNRLWLREIFSHLARGMDTKTMITGYETLYDSTGIYTVLFLLVYD